MKFSGINYSAEIAQKEDKSYEIRLNAANGGMLFSAPLGAAVSLNGEEHFCLFDEAVQDGNKVIFGKNGEGTGWKRAELTVLFFEDNIEFGFELKAETGIGIDRIELFRNGRKGLYMADCIRYFAPAPRNYNGINRAFNRSFPDCSIDCYFAPAPLNFSIGNANGWFSFGLLDLPNSEKYYLSPRLGVVIEQPEGRIAVGESGTYSAVRLMMSFPADEWEGEQLFRDLLIRKGRIRDRNNEKKQFPAWWQRPTVCTYGDQMMDLQYNWYTDDDWGSPDFTQQWLEAWLDNAERTLGRTDFTIIVDAFWQHIWSAEPKPDTDRFPDLRGFIDECHRRGHRVLLWQPPFTDAVDNGFETMSQKFGVLSDVYSDGLAKRRYYIDFTADNAKEYLEAVARGFFGDGEGELDCDGLKMDFLSSFMPVKNGQNQHPERGIGILGLYNFYKLFDEAARKVKKDVFLDGSACDPRIEEVLHINRLHDIQNVYGERELRARVSSLAAPGIIIDSDGAIMLSTWVKETYLNACLYSTPSLYYIRKFHDGISLPAETMRSLSGLLALSERKKYGTVRFLSPGNWRLMEEEEVAGATFNGETIEIYDRDEKHLHLFTWSENCTEIPVLGRLPKNTGKDFSMKEQLLTGSFEAGRVYTFEIREKELCHE